MSVVFALLVVLNIIGVLGTRQPDIDINRIRLLPQAPPSSHRRRSIISNHIRKNDHDYYSSRSDDVWPPMLVRYDTSPLAEAKTGKIHQPREDPRLFYQSDSYLEEVNRKNLNNEITSIYLGRGLVRANEQNLRFERLRDNQVNSIDEGICVKCPSDRTLITKAGLDRAMLQYPRILTCSGRKAPRDVRFVHMYGPNFGSLLKEGSHIVVGRIIHKGEILQTCKMQIHVLVQTCTVPKYLVSHCAENKTCHFTCRSPKAELRGHNTLTCGDDMKWTGHLPVCSLRTWCQPVTPPKHGRISCKGVTSSTSSGLKEGSSCRVRCARGWKWGSRGVAICRRGQWTHDLTCIPKDTK